MAKNRALRRQARAIAAGGLPSAGSIKRQYHRQEGDVADFSSALVSLLKGQQGVAGQAYGSAIQQQQGIDDAARQQLGNLGEQYGAGSAVKVGATGDSAVSSLLGGQAAAQDYASRQPGIAASRGALGQTALENALSDALSQRRDQIHQGFLPAYLQLKQNAFSQKMALSQLGLSRQQLADSESAQAFSQSEQLKQDRQSNRHFWASLNAQYGGQAPAGKNGRPPAQPWLAYQMTPTQWHASTTDALAQAEKAANQGVGPAQFIDEITRVGNVPPEIALDAVRRIYGNLKPTNPRVHPKLATAYQEYQHWLSQVKGQTEPRTPSQKAHRHR